MLKILLNIPLYFVLILIILSSASQVEAFSGYGNGTSSYPYQITSCALLQEMSSDLDAYYEQNNDIDCTGITFVPIGDNTNKFIGNFNGNNFAITNISISGSDYVGLFGNILNATLSNIRLTSGTVTSTSNDYVGSLVGWSVDTTITHCGASLTIPGTSDSMIGGLIGYGRNLTLDKSFYSGIINANNASPNNVAGLIAAIAGTSIISNSYSSGTYNSSVPGYGGGLFGALYAGPTVTTSNVYSSASVTLGANVTFGGLSGAYNQSISNSFSAVTKSGSTTNVFGAVFGFSGATVSSVHFDATLNGTSNCSGDGTTNCTAQNSGNVAPNFFKGNNTNAPMSSWNFTDTWQVNSGNYPTLLGFTSPSPINPIRTAYVAPAPLAPLRLPTPTCSDSLPVGVPNLFQIDSTGTSATLSFATTKNTTGYRISYGLDANANQYGDNFSDPSVLWILQRTINMLQPNTTYYFKIQSANGCNGGAWSPVKSVRTGSNLISADNVLGVTAVGSCSYAVKEGDSFWKIASKQLGSGSRFGELESLNPGVSVLQIGQTISVCK